MSTTTTHETDEGEPIFDRFRAAALHFGADDALAVRIAWQIESTRTVGPYTRDGESKQLPIVRAMRDAGMLRIAPGWEDYAEHVWRCPMLCLVERIA